MIENMKVRRFKEEDAQEVRNLIVRNFLEVNSKDYGISAMEKLAKAYDAEKVLNVASYAHMYVFEFDGKIIGTGSISSFWESETESILLSIFVLPEFHGKGVGRKIINILDSTEQTQPVVLETVSEEKQETGDKKLAMPVYTKEELLQKAEADGDEPEVIEDEVSGVTLVDYSDVL